MKRVLLISNSTLHGSGYLDHCAEEFRRFLGPGVTRVLFVPYALHDRAAYAAKSSRFPKWPDTITVPRPTSARMKSSSTWRYW